MGGSEWTTFTLRDFAEIAAIGGGWVATIVKLDGRLKAIERDFKDVLSLTRWRERMEERTQGMRREIDELKHGQGFVRIDGEYDKEGKTDAR